MLVSIASNLASNSSYSLKNEKKIKNRPKISKNIREGLPSPKVVGYKYHIKITLLNTGLWT